MVNEMLIEAYLKADEEKTEEIYSEFCSGEIDKTALLTAYRTLSEISKTIIQITKEL